MAEPQEPFPGADGIRSLKDQDSIFRAFDSYPWTKDAAFLSGLRAILGPPNPSSSSQKGSLRDIATHARIFYYAQRIGVNIDFAAYHAWLAQHPDHSTPHIVPPEYEQQPTPSHTAAAAAAPPPPQAEATPWQQAAPKADLYVQRNKPSSPSSHSHASSSEPEPAYPIAFAEMIKLLQEGKPIPGIRQIPNTIERDPAVKPVGSRPVPRKPWEREASATAEASSGFAENILDLEFPPVEQAATAATQS
ncbi:uncharacterized protein TRIREDRAFT_102799 [Trichoderma reesei QM6a]|uniref:Predicted protein n=2 Tax=Hypocrea jecorina TaxID=51453 RepID=G0R8B0_HYPJQ|nr:uncharacterized protein TRIREDRAFT_102799 [Trichoderma reesei QM6a]EGR52849.1 predicted protein [Trichoderma reesei QM6a]ETS06608.1 hypothetical protein M419DRAFT_126040 [Trichoderma reesei RUT C-30]